MRNSLWPIVQSLVCFICLGLCTSTNLSFASGATVYVTAAGNDLRDARLTEGSSLIGFVGDLVQLQDGFHEVAIAGPRNYTLQVTLKVARNLIEVTGTRHWPANCEPELHVRWPRPTVSVDSGFKNVVAIILDAPRFGEPTGLKHCAAAAMIGCNKRKALITTSSEPTGAEIWINGKRQPYLTNE